VSLRPPDAIDRGLARERTLLAWNRSALSVAALGALLLHAGRNRGWDVVGYVSGTALLLLAAGSAIYGRLLYERRRGAPAGPYELDRRTAARVITAATLAAAVVSLLLALAR
jgi:uncharacterized membrane protein YidH (DUF202 family)